MGELTYEELFELARRERTNEDLQFLDENFYIGLVKYFQEKQKVIQTQDTVFGSSERESVQGQLENAKKITRELIERREKKILTLALNKVRTGSDIIDTSALLGLEKEFFHQASELLSQYKIGVLGNILSLQLPKFGDAKAGGLSAGKKKEMTNESKEIAETTEKTEETKEEISGKEPEALPSGEIGPAAENTPAQEPQETSLASSTVTQEAKLVRFISPVPRFLGKNQEIYGPYEENQTATLSTEIAQILITKGRAVEIEK